MEMMIQIKQMGNDIVFDFDFISCFVICKHVYAVRNKLKLKKYSFIGNNADSAALNIYIYIYLFIIERISHPLSPSLLLVMENTNRMK